MELALVDFPVNDTRVAIVPWGNRERRSAQLVWQRVRQTRFLEERGGFNRGVSTIAKGGGRGWEFFDGRPELMEVGSNCLNRIGEREVYLKCR
ncbi:hypothetical protein K0M31_010215 [Melipona bicolor]|uniref:Uncharacterized protein n=1 Tax=Melipona bicolor TaxID=60889 RepID=A0AA40FM37_9HYME|nr:hypothetical protein K0M31_010215 [Melipona bicolor]